MGGRINPKSLIGLLRNTHHADGKDAGTLDRQSVARLPYDELNVFRKCPDDALPFGEAEACGHGQRQDEIFCLANVLSGFLGCKGALHGGDVVQAVGKLDQHCFFVPAHGVVVKVRFLSGALGEEEDGFRNIAAEMGRVGNISRGYTVWAVFERVVK